MGNIEARLIPEWLSAFSGPGCRAQTLGGPDRLPPARPGGGAPRDPTQMAAVLKRALNDAFRQVSARKARELLERRYERLQSYGRFTDTKAGK